MAPDEFSQFCERHQSAMYNVAQSILHDSQQSEDAVQEAFVGIFKAFHNLRFETERAEKVYCLHAVRNAAYDILRKSTPAIDIDEEIVDGLSFELGDTTFDRVSASETIMAIQEAVHGLSPKEKTIFTYRMIGLHDAEISKTLGISVSDVRTTVYRVRQKLHRALREEGFEFGLAGSDNGR